MPWKLLRVWNKPSRKQYVGKIRLNPFSVLSFLYSLISIHLKDLNYLLCSFSLWRTQWRWRFFLRSHTLSHVSRGHPLRQVLFTCDLNMSVVEISLFRFSGLALIFYLKKTKLSGQLQPFLLSAADDWKRLVPARNAMFGIVQAKFAGEFLVFN